MKVKRKVATLLSLGAITLSLLLSFHGVAGFFVPVKASTPPNVFKHTDSNIYAQSEITADTRVESIPTNVLVAQTTTSEIPNTIVIPGNRIYENDPNASSEDSINTQQINPRVFSDPQVLVNANPISITLYDNGGEQDGDIVTVSLDGIAIPGLDGVQLTSAGQTFFINLGPGINRLGVTALNNGSFGDTINTASLVILPSQVLSANNVLDANQSANNTTFVTIGYPLISVSALSYPESALHILQAQVIGYPRLLTIDRPNAKRRRRQSIRNYLKRGGRRGGRGQDLDEYPPAVFLENGGNADVRPINRSDNRGSGASIGNQLRPYANGVVVDLVVTP